MVIAQRSYDEDQQPRAVPLEFFPLTPKVDGNNQSTLITDFFDWLETAWQLPLFQTSAVHPLLPSTLTLTEEQYTITDIARLCGCSFDWLYRYLKRSAITSSEWVSYVSPTGIKG